MTENEAEAFNYLFRFNSSFLDHHFLINGKSYYHVYKKQN